MSSAKQRQLKIKSGKADLARLTSARANVWVIHYSCESFFDRPNGASPRVTSIAVRNWATAQTVSFSIHQVAERKGVFEPEEIRKSYDYFEKEMLCEYFNFANQRADALWLHWNMRDANYGFQAIEQRYRVLAGKIPPASNEGNRIDLPRLLSALYGHNYAKHPKMQRFIQLNKITDIGFMSGKKEADAFESSDFVPLHQSTLRKVGVLSDVTERLADGSLETDAKKKDIYGSTIAYGIEQLKEHPAFTVISSLAAVAGIIAAVTSIWNPAKL